eukprot:CAMPEP_0197260040 /NCGR_PEP_ID=MMETSP1429-20130617/83831_1 /TAXON_ID=49237 /ORGANISM="Chaetoceros  sp., Strain UNC1202" /LENGTH=200 /DNA_ID=CAMNT_0042724271 /DNA_START=544 /DNA_END=1146 /DNA_ORIENTATION=+
MHAEMLSWMKDEKCFDVNMEGDDQSIHNYLFYSGNLPFATAIPNREGIVSTVGVEAAWIWGMHAAMYGSDATSIPFPGADEGNGRWIGLHYSLTDEKGYHINFNGETSAVIHQHDRYGPPFQKWLRLETAKVFEVEHTTSKNIESTMKGNSESEPLSSSKLSNMDVLPRAANTVRKVLDLNFEGQKNVPISKPVLRPRVF